MFTERSDILADADPIRGYGLAVTPGRDGPLLFVAGHGEPNRLYSRDGDAFVDTACGIVADGTRHGTGVCAADLDADGCEELYVHNCANGVDGGGDSDLRLEPARIGSGTAGRTRSRSTRTPTGSTTEPGGRSRRSTASGPVVTESPSPDTPPRSPSTNWATTER